MKTFDLILAVMLLLPTGAAFAEKNTPEVDEGISNVKQKKFDFSAESRLFSNDAAPEFLLRVKNVSTDWIHADGAENFCKLKFEREIFSLMGTGFEWHVALNAVDERGKSLAVLPSVGVNLYMRIRPRLDVYLQFSGFTFGRRAHFTDFESGFKYWPRKDFSISAGWRSVDFKFRRGGEVGDFDLNGLFVGVRYDF